MKRAADWINTIKGHAKKAMQAYSAFMEKQGFYLVLTICVLVIVGTAVWTRATRTPTPPPATDNGQAAVNPYEGVQRLADVTAPPAATRSLPTATPQPPLLRPVPGALIRSFNNSTPEYFEVTGMWQVHNACDYQAKTGDAVAAIGEGAVLSVTDSGTLGKSVVIDHGAGLIATYGGLSMNSYVKIGDPVKSGQTIGLVGNTTLFETDAGPHLHFFAVKRGEPIDPETLFTSNIQ